MSIPPQWEWNESHPNTAGQLPALTSRMWMAHGDKRWVIMKMTRTDITTNIAKNQKSQPGSYDLEPSNGKFQV